MRHEVAAVAALLVVSCSSQDKADNGSAAGNEAGAREKAGGSGPGGVTAIALQPGAWETTVEVLRMEIPNMPKGMRPPNQAAVTSSMCLTPEQAAAPNANFFGAGGESGGCNYDNFSMAGGRIQGTVQCNIGGSTSRSTMSGQFTPTSYSITSQTEATAGGMTTRSDVRVTARRVGDCTGG